MCSPPPTLRGLSPSLLGSPLGGAQAEQFVIHTQRGPTGHSDSKRQGDHRRNAPNGALTPGSPRRRGTKTTGSKHTPSSASRSEALPHEKTRHRGSSVTPPRGSPRKNLSNLSPSPQHIASCIADAEHPRAMPAIESTGLPTEEELRKQNDELRLQVQALRDEQHYTAELHSQVIATVVKERNDLAEKLQAERDNLSVRSSSAVVSGEGCEGSMADAVNGTATSGGPCASPQTPSAADLQKVKTSRPAAEEQPQEAYGTARSLSHSPHPPHVPEDSVHSFTIGPLKEDASFLRGQVVIDGMEDGEEAKFPMLPPRPMLAPHGALASRAQCWELQGALRKALQSQRASLRMTKSPALGEHVVFAPPLMAPPPSPCLAALGRATVPGRKSNAPIEDVLMSMHARASATPMRSRSTFGGGELPSALLARGVPGPVRQPRAPVSAQSSSSGVLEHPSSGQGCAPLGRTSPFKPGPSRSGSARGASPPSQGHLPFQTSGLAPAASVSSFRGSGSARGTSPPNYGHQMQGPCLTPVSSVTSFRGLVPTVTAAPSLARSASAAFVEIAAATRDTTPIRGSSNNKAWGSPVAGASFPTFFSMSRTSSAESFAPLPAALMVPSPCRSSVPGSSAAVRVIAASASAPRLATATAVPVAGPKRQVSGKLPSAAPSVVNSARGSSVVVAAAGVATTGVIGSPEAVGNISMSATPSTARLPTASVLPSDSQDWMHAPAADMSELPSCHIMAEAPRVGNKSMNSSQLIDN